MIYGARKPEHSLLVVAADTIGEFATFRMNATKHRALFKEMRQPTMQGMKLYPEYDAFKIPPYTLDFEDEERLEAFVTLLQIEVLPIVKATDCHMAMWRGEQQKIEMRSTKTVGQLEGLTDYDPWADRKDSDQQQAIIEQFIEKGKAEGMSDDSFAGPEITGDMKLTDLTVSFDADGKPKVERGGAKRMGRSMDAHASLIRNAEEQVRKFGAIQKTGFILFHVFQKPIDDEGEEFETLIFLVKKKRFIDPNKLAVACTTTDVYDTLPGSILEIQPGIFTCGKVPPTDIDIMLRKLGYYPDATIHEVVERFAPTEQDKRGRELSSDEASVFFRFDCDYLKLDRLDEELSTSDHTYVNSANGYGETKTGVWFAFAREALAKAFHARLAAKDISVSDVYSVNAVNKRLIAADANAKATSLQINVTARPWNEMAVELATMSDDDKAKNRASYSGSEFLFCRDESLDEHSIRIRIAPRDFFQKNEAFYAASLDIEHILPDYLKEIEPSIYEARNIDWAWLRSDMVDRYRFTDSMGLKLYLNGL